MTIYFNRLLYINVMKKEKLTKQEIWNATRPNVYKSKKNYTRKPKHKNKY